MTDSTRTKDALISSTSVIYENVFIGNAVQISEFCAIGKPSRDMTRHDRSRTTIGEKTMIGSYCLLYEGCSIGNNCLIRDYSSIGEDSILANEVKVQYRAQVNKRVSIGENSRVGGFCCNDSIIGNHCTMYGSLVHHYPKHGGCKKEKAPTLESGVIIAFGAIIAGNIIIGKNSYIGAGAIVTKDVPENSIVIGANKIFPKNLWKGRLEKTGKIDD